MTLRCTLLAAVAIAIASPALAAPAQPVVFPPANFDTTCAPCRDFDQYANGGWMKTHTIPGTQASWGSFNELAERNLSVLHDILDKAAASKTAKAGSGESKLGLYYGTCMDSVEANREGAKPLQPLLSAVDGMKDPHELAGQVAWLHAHGVRGLFGFAATQDVKNSDMMIAAAVQGGIGLPDREYYLRRDSASVATRREYTDHIVRSFQLLGSPEPEARAAADQVLAIETSLARNSYTNVQRRDPNANYHKLAVAQLQQLTPAFDWATYLTRRGKPGLDSLNVAQVTFFQGLDSVITATPLAAWKSYLRWRVLEDAEATLSEAFVQEDFRFARVMSGVTEMQPRWKRCLRSTDQGLGDLLGQEYVRQQFSPAAKERALRMVHNLEAALDDRLATLEWMSPETRQAAKVKLAAFAEKIGFPDKWREYGVDLKRQAFFANRAAVREFEVARQFNKIGKPTERGEWNMTPPTVNAFYSPTLNSINFPAGILQPPFYDPSWDDAANYGAIGAVIGHEMTHGFDDQGRQFDPKGNLRDWWAAEDASRYKERANLVAEQFSGYTVLDTVHVNGRLTLGENIADLGGLAIAYAALQKEMAGKPRPGLVEGFTPEQRFYLAYAQIWRRLQRPEAVRTQVNVDPHSPGHWRVNGPLSNLDEFAKAFGCKEGDPMVRNAEQRARIW